MRIKGKAKVVVFHATTVLSCNLSLRNEVWILGN